MALFASIHVPCELRANERSRWFRLTRAISLDALALLQPAPDELDGVFEVAFVLPGDTEAIRCRARAGRDGDALVFSGLQEAAALRISDYIKEQLSS